jgi:hypothetical protein
VALCGAGIIYALIGWLGDRPLVLIFAVLQLGAQLVNLAIFSRTHRLTPMVWVFIGLGLAPSSAAS